MSTEDIFESEAKKLVLAALDGYNVTIFAYGQTASGKTFTMRGNETQQGLIPLALHDIFNELERSYGQFITGGSQNEQEAANVERSWVVRVSYLEIYNECVNDLLDPARKNLSVRENQSGKPFIEGLSEYEVLSI